MHDIIIGIDLGTTNSEVAIVTDGKVTVINNGDTKMLPSYVGFNDNGHIIVGETARNQYLVYPERTIKSIKRLMGQDILVELAGQAYSPQEISAIILKHLKAIAESHVGQVISKAVITVPAFFSDAQRQATREAGEIAGLEVVRIINEPTAAALAYDTGQVESHQVLVYDLGGGTFDVSIVNIEAGVVEVLSSHGDNQLGGDDFDQLIVDYLVEQLHTQYQVDARLHSKAMARINRAAENAKITLSDQPYAQIEEEYLIEDQGAAIHLSLELSRMQYEEMIAESIDMTLDSVHKALKSAKLTTADINDIILVGGSSRTPCIRERLLNEFGFEPHSSVDPDLCVTMGAAIQAAMIAGQKVDKVLVDITPYTYGTSAIGSLMGQPYPFMYVPIIHKNTVLPNRQSDAFSTSYDGQNFVEITLYQGEDPDALNNIKIGEFRVEGLLDVDAGNIITLTLGLDLNGILHVSAQEKVTGLEKNITINNALSQFEGDTLDTARQRISSLLGQMDPRIVDEVAGTEIDAPEAEEIIRARQLIAKAEGLFDQVSSEDKEDMSDLIATLTACMARKDIQGLDTPVAQLQDILYYLES